MYANHHPNLKLREIYRRRTTLPHDPDSDQHIMVWLFRVLVSQPKNSAQPVFALADNEALVDTYKAITVLWTHYITQRTTAVISENVGSEETHSFRLRVHRKHTNIIQQYLQHIRREAAEMEKKGRELLVQFLY